MAVCVCCLPPILDASIYFGMMQVHQPGSHNTFFSPPCSAWSESNHKITATCRGHVQYSNNNVPGRLLVAGNGRRAVDPLRCAEAWRVTEGGAQTAVELKQQGCMVGVVFHGQHLCRDFSSRLGKLETGIIITLVELVLTVVVPRLVMHLHRSYFVNSHNKTIFRRVAMRAHNHWVFISKYAKHQHRTAALIPKKLHFASYDQHRTHLQAVFFRLLSPALGSIG